MRRYLLPQGHRLIRLIEVSDPGFGEGGVVANEAAGNGPTEHTGVTGGRISRLSFVTDGRAWLPEPPGAVDSRAGSGEMGATRNNPPQSTERGANKPQ